MNDRWFTKIVYQPVYDTNMYIRLYDVFENKIIFYLRVKIKVKKFYLYKKEFDEVDEDI